MKITKKDYEQMQGRLSVNKTGIAMWVGIDPGVHTGIAVWNPLSRSFVSVESSSAVDIEGRVLMLFHALGNTLHVCVEDTRNLRLPKHLQSPGRTKGAGSVGRDMDRWSEFLEFHKIPHTMVGMSPKEFRTGDDAWFRKKTGWDKRTNDHGRSAAGLVWGK